MHFVMAGAPDVNRWHCIEALGYVKSVASVKPVASGKCDVDLQSPAARTAGSCNIP